MEPNNIENDFKQKLNQREIIPTAAAWDRLDAMLAVAEDKKSKPKWGWLYIAASVLGFLFVGTVFLSQTQEIVDVKRDSVVYKNNEIVKPLETLSKEKVTNSVVASISKPKNESKKELKDSNKKIDLIKNQKPNNTNETLLAVETLKPNNNVLVNESENLITGNTKSVVEMQTIKVNANDLLSQVDGELDLSFREKVIKSINKNYKSVKVALANRNQQ